MSAEPYSIAAPLAGAGGDLVAVIDVGSNSVRLVVFAGPLRGRLPIFNEKVACGLGRSQDATGLLDERGRVRALATLRRFVALAARMRVTKLVAIATAAVRDADDGDAFVAEVEQACGLRLEVVSGAEEARLAAYGVLYGHPEADGLIGDLGGGSLELVALSGGRVGRSATLPLGPLRLGEVGDRHARRKFVDDKLATVDWLANMIGRPFYVVGGNWRALGRVHMEQTHYPIHIVDNYTLDAATVRDISRLMARQSRGSLTRITAVSSRRVETVPLAALVLRRLLKIIDPSRVVFSAQGLREGVLYRGLSTAQRRRDPLLEACTEMARHENRFAVAGRELFEWTGPLFPGEDEAAARLRHAACLLSDVGWRVHPDYRGEQAFRRILRAPVPGIDHRGRATVALAVHARYRGDGDQRVVSAALRLLDADQQRTARQIGFALRLAHTLGGGTAAALPDTDLQLTVDELVLRVGPSTTDLVGEVVERRVNALARAFERAPKIVMQA